MSINVIIKFIVPLICLSFYSRNIFIIYPQFVIKVQSFSDGFQYFSETSLPMLTADGSWALAYVLGKVVMQ